MLWLCVLAIDDAVVVVRCGRGWGSGVVVDSESGTIITCSHAVASASTSPVSVHWKGKTLDARLVFRTRDGVAFDVAVLDVGPNSGLREVSFDNDPPHKGDQVVAAGFPLFSERDLPYLLPTITRGVVSHVAGGGSAILHTTCCVQSGASGGAVLRLGDGLPLRLVALVACNIQEQGSGALFPHVNLAVPATVMAAPLAGYRATRDVKFLHALESKDPNVQRLWKLQPLTSKL